MRVLEVTTKTLRNGLTVLYVHLPHVHSAALAFTARGGPRYESLETQGLSHVMEHLLLRGTRAHPTSLAFHRAVEDLGGEINGATQRDAVTLHMTVPPSSTAAAARLLAECCLEPLMTGLDVEREVIREEILDTLDVDGADLDLDVLSRRVLWPNHPMGRSITGPLHNLDRFTEAQARRHHARTFVALNGVLIIAGPGEPALLHPHVAKAFAPMPRGQRLVAPRPPRPPRWAPVHVQPSDHAQATLLLTFPAPHENDARFSALLLMQRLLDDGFSARLRQAICEQRGLAYSLAVSMDAYGDCGALDIELSCAPEKLVEALDQTLNVLQDIAQTPVGDKELRRVKHRHICALEFCRDDPEALCGWFAGSVLMGSKGDFVERLEEVKGVQPSQLRALAQEMFSPEHALLTLVGPVERPQVRQMGRMLQRPPHEAVWGGTPTLAAVQRPAFKAS